MAPLQSWARTWTPMGTLSEWFVGRCVRLHLLVFGYLVFVKLPSASWLVFGQYFGGIYPGQHFVLVSATAWNRRTCSCHGVLVSRGLCTCSPHSSTIQAMQVSNRAAARVRVRMMYLHCNVCGLAFVRDWRTGSKTVGPGQSYGPGGISPRRPWAFGRCMWAIWMGMETLTCLQRATTQAPSHGVCGSMRMPCWFHPQTSSSGACLWWR
jgi:hypothetical protein